MNIPNDLLLNVIEYGGDKNYIFSAINKNYLEIYTNKYKNKTTNICNNLSLNNVKFAVNNKHKLYIYITNIVTINGNLECLKYLHENNCPWSATTCRFAAMYGELECLKYLHENNCPWDETTYSYAAIHAARYNQLDCLEYLQENGCPRPMIL